MTTGEITKKIRKSHGLSQEAFAAPLGVTKQAVSAWEHDKTKPAYFFLVSAITQFTNYYREWALQCLDNYHVVSIPLVTTPGMAQSYPEPSINAPTQAG